MSCNYCLSAGFESFTNQEHRICPRCLTLIAVLGYPDAIDIARNVPNLIKIDRSADHSCYLLVDSQNNLPVIQRRQQSFSVVILLDQNDLFAANVVLLEGDNITVDNYYQSSDEVAAG